MGGTNTRGIIRAFSEGSKRLSRLVFAVPRDKEIKEGKVSSHFQVVKDVHRAVQEKLANAVKSIGNLFTFRTDIDIAGIPAADTEFLDERLPEGKYNRPSESLTPWYALEYAKLGNGKAGVDPIYANFHEWLFDSEQNFNVDTRTRIYDGYTGSNEPYQTGQTDSDNFKKEYHIINDGPANARGVAAEHKLQGGQNLIHVVLSTGTNVCNAQGYHETRGLFNTEENLEAHSRFISGETDEWTVLDPPTKVENGRVRFGQVFAGGMDNDPASDVEGIRGQIKTFISRVKQSSTDKLREALQLLKSHSMLPEGYGLQELSEDPLIKAYLRKDGYDGITNKYFQEHLESGNSPLATALGKAYAYRLAHALIYLLGHKTIKAADAFSLHGSHGSGIFKPGLGNHEVFAEEIKKTKANYQGDFNQDFIVFKPKADMDGLYEASEIRAKAIAAQLKLTL